jgi:peptidoglycan/LPS O-acetylase OafA/YrhL
LNLKQFYFKRILRTFPAFYFYLTITAIVLLLLGIFEISQFWRAPLYLENYHPRSSWTKLQWFVGHSWSLAVEEQFYLLSAILYYILRRKANLKKEISKWLFAVVFIVPCIRFFYILIPGIPILLTGSIHRSFETVADSLAIGGLAYLFRNEIICYHSFKKLERNNSIIFFVCFVFLLQFLGSKYIIGVVGYLPRIFYNGIGISILQVIIALLMIIFINKKKDFLWKILNNKITIWVGKLSYSIYLWQQIWFYSGWSFNLWERMFGIFVCSAVTYYFIELPAIKWRDSKLKIAR